MKDYLTVASTETAEIVVRRSRFIASIANVADAAAANEFICQQKAKYKDATHNCYAYILDDTDMKCSDDGEPQGTAGLPILEVLKKNELKYTALVVTRYFGKVKLGSKGLIGAYSASAAKIIRLAKKIRRIYSDYFEIQLDYSQIDKLEQAIKKNHGIVINTTYLQAVTTEFVLPVTQFDALEKDIQDLTLGQGKITKIKSGYFGYSIKR